MKKDNKFQIVRDYERLILENADLRYFNQLYENTSLRNTKNKKRKK